MRVSKAFSLSDFTISDVLDFLVGWSVPTTTDFARSTGRRGDLSSNSRAGVMPDQVQTNAVVMTPSRMSTQAASIRTTSSVTARDGEYVILVVSAIRDVLIRGTRCLAAIVNQARARLFSTACRIPVLSFDV